MKRSRMQQTSVEVTVGAFMFLILLALGFFTFVLSRENVLCREGRGWIRGWRDRVFAYLARNAQSATAFFGLPANRVVELGMQVEL